MTTQVLVKPLGLMNRPNQYGKLPLGSMSQCDGVFIRKSNTLQATSAPSAWTSAVASSVNLDLLASTDNINSTDQRLLAITDTGTTLDTARWYPASGVPTAAEAYADLLTFGVNIDFTLIPNRPLFFRHRNRIFVLTERGVVVHDNLVPTTTNERTPRVTGLPSGPFVVGVNSAAAVGGPFAALQLAAYRAVVVRKYPDGYVTRSVPSTPILFVNTSGAAANANVLVRMPAPFYPFAETTLELYRTYIRDNAIDPGATYYLCRSIVQTSGNAGNNFFQIDTAANTALGLELYTNPGVEGALQQNNPPPVCKTAATYKGFAFYGNLAQPPRARFLIPITANAVYLGGDPKRVTAIGQRTGSGTSSIGSPTLTAVSAADIVGIVIGQAFSHAGWPALTMIVTAVGATTITVSGNATVASAASVFVATDRMYYRNNFTGSWALFVASNFQPDVVNTSSAFGFSATASHVADSPVSGLGLDGIEVTYEPSSASLFSSFELLATNGQNYAPSIPTPLAFPISTGQSGLTTSQTFQPNAFQWSKDQQPEACPVVNIGFAGSGQLLKIESTRDAAFFFCTDGIYRLSGSGGQWRLDPVDTSTIISGPKCTGVMRDTVYAYTSVGLVSISSDQAIQRLSGPIINELQGSPYSETSNITLICDEQNNEVWLALTPQIAGSKWYVYSAETNTFVTYNNTFPTTAVTYSRKPVANGVTPCLEFAQESGANDVIAHIQEAPSVYDRGIAVFNPIYGKSPETIKQWIRATHIFSATGNAPYSRGFFNSTLYPTPVQSRGPFSGNDTRTTFYVNRENAISGTVVVGAVMNESAPSLFYYEYLGFSIEYNELTVQPRAR